MVGLAGLALQDAKRFWLGVNLALLAAVVYMLSRATGIPVERIALLAFYGHNFLAANFVYGQYYVFLLCVMADAVPPSFLTCSEPIGRWRC
jgi:hypothetical protein